MMAMSDSALLQRMKDVHEIQNLMGRYVYLHTAAEFRKLIDLFASKTTGVCVEMNWGVYDGYESIKRWCIGFHEYMAGDRIGYMVLLPVTTPVIEVAGDGQTAKGLWICTGTRTEDDKAAGKPEGCWAWTKNGVDFVKEDGVWKIWHFQVYGIFFAPYETGWTVKNEHVRIDPPEHLRPDRPPTYSWMYSSTGKTELVPAPPEPYDTWDGKSMTTAVLPLQK